jgi:single-strand DNA-binding protein
VNGIEAALIARLGKEPELRRSRDGKPWLPLNVAVGEGDDTQWLAVTVFGDRAQELAGVLHKGDRIYVEGRLRLENWTGQDGQPRSGLKLAAWKIERLGEIGRNRPPKPRTPPEGSSPSPCSALATDPEAARRDWQRPPADADLITF